ncbi:serine/threonine-protein kinase [Streptomyces sp. ACA25]|uniref:serine/threonine protein kinase n=1 Tax=Streptomyces sp. ACA25 TaxID=3022596 RepID=UPI002307437B|nr:serine/threonine-protein kinase [Streptomyces sp. ACA25]MDB1086271.1 serine/threonine-protein kinase [Streptomyces sp. ACA25]
MGEIFAGRYELIDPIGRGGVGAVWRSWDHRRKRYVAAKVLQQSDAHTLLRFVREQALRIDHPHVLAPASWAADDDKVLFTMDLMSGGSLSHLIGDYGALPPRFVCTLLSQLLSGLQAVHDEGVVHRDIKPANILLEPTGQGRPHLRLSDFGISMRKGEPRLTETNYVVGTPGYFAPEQMRGAEPDFTADLYAVGLVGLYLLTGRKPDSQALLVDYGNGVPPAPEGVPAVLWEVLGTLLQPDPESRFRTANGARKALASAAEMLPDTGPQGETVEVFDQLGPLPPGFRPDGPERGQDTGTAPLAPPSAGSPSETGSFHLPPPQPSMPAPQLPSTPPPPPPFAGTGTAGTGTAGTGPTVYEQPTALSALPPQQPAPAPVGAPASMGGAYPQPAPGGPVSTGHASTGHAPAGPGPARSAGPPVKVAVPLMLLAFLLIGFGVWSLLTA